MAVRRTQALHKSPEAIRRGPSYLIVTVPEEDEADEEGSFPKSGDSSNDVLTSFRLAA